MRGFVKIGSIGIQIGGIGAIAKRAVGIRTQPSQKLGTPGGTGDDCWIAGVLYDSCDRQHLVVT